jgi:hypothetical protein
MKRFQHDEQNIFAAIYLRRNEFDDADITRLDEFGGLFNGLSSSTIDFLDELGKFASNVGSVAIQHRCITSTYLTRVVKNDDLGIERISLLRRVVLGIRGNISASNILDRHVPEKLCQHFKFSEKGNRVT